MKELKEYIQHRINIQVTNLQYAKAIEDRLIYESKRLELKGILDKIEELNLK